MATISLLEAFNEFQDIKGIDKETLMELLDEIFKGVLEKNMVMLRIFILQ